MRFPGGEDPDGEPEPWLPDFRAFAALVGARRPWSFSPKGYAGSFEGQPDSA